MARRKPRTTKDGASLAREAAPYTHPEAESLLRPDVGTQAQFPAGKRKPAARYRYDSSLAPELAWDGQNAARELGEWLLAAIEDAARLEPPHRFPAPRELKSQDGTVRESVGGLADAVAKLKALKADSSSQVHARPARDAEPEVLRSIALSTAYVPPMSGLLTDEGLWARRERVDALLGQGRPGEVIRNLLVEASESGSVWQRLVQAVDRLFSFTLQMPQIGASITAEYVVKRTGERLDVASAGSGFQQVLMLLTFLNTRPGAVLLLDEPDAHLHILLQDAIYGELRALAAEQGSKLVIATHSEVIINTVPVGELWHLLDRPQRIQSREERSRLSAALGRLSNADVMAALAAPGVLYVENYTDLDLLRELARALGHPAFDLLAMDPFWKPIDWQPRPDAKGVSARDHFDSLLLVNPNLRGLELRDSDNRPEPPETPITGKGFQRLRWKRYEIESYLVHPVALVRFVEAQLGGETQAREAVRSLESHMKDTFPPAFLANPHGDHAWLAGIKARTDVLPPLLDAAGLPGFPCQRYHEIASVMLPEEIHPEVREKLDQICKAFGIAP